MSAPILPPAPARLSTTTCCPRSAPSGCATIRETMSTPLPGDEGAMSLIGLVGYACAKTTPVNAKSVLARMKWGAGFIMPSVGGVEVAMIPLARSATFDDVHRPALRKKRHSRESGNPFDVVRGVKFEQSFERR